MKKEEINKLKKLLDYCGCNFDYIKNHDDFKDISNEDLLDGYREILNTISEKYKEIPTEIIQIKDIYLDKSVKYDVDIGVRKRNVVISQLGSRHVMLLMDYIWNLQYKIRLAKDEIKRAVLNQIEESSADPKETKLSESNSNEEIIKESIERNEDNDKINKDSGDTDNYNALTHKKVKNNNYNNKSLKNSINLMKNITFDSKPKIESHELLIHNPDEENNDKEIKELEDKQKYNEKTSFSNTYNESTGENDENYGNFKNEDNKLTNKSILPTKETMILEKENESNNIFYDYADIIKFSRYDNDDI